MTTFTTYTPLSAVIPRSLWPEGLFDYESPNFLDRLACLVYDERGGDETFNIYLKARVMAEARMGLPFLKGISLVLGKGDSPESGLIDVDIFASFSEGDLTLELFLSTTVLSLGLDREWLKPVKIEEKDGKINVIPEEGNVNIPIPLVLHMKYENGDWLMDFLDAEGKKPSLSIPTCMIGDTGVIIKANNISMNFSGQGERPNGTNADWKGLYMESVTLYIPRLFNGNVKIEAEGLGIGSGGIYGKITAKSEPSKYLVTGILGMEGGITSVSLNFVKNVPVEVDIKGKLQVPFFDQLIEIDIGIDIEGKFTVGVIDNTGKGLFALEKANVLKIEVSSIAFESETSGFTTRLSGKLTPLFKGEALEWPSIDIRELCIDSLGNIRLEGGWLDLLQQPSLLFYGFQFEITRLGFGKTEEGGKWIGFSGSLKLVDGLQAGASVEGLRLTWYDDRAPQISFNGLGIEFEVPGVIRFKGEVSYYEKDNRFQGEIELELLALELKIDGTLVAGSTKGNNYFFIKLEIELPAGIPLWATGLAMYGMSGLFAVQMAPNRQSNEEWYEGWYKRQKEGVTYLDKWTPREGSMVLGCGITLGTVSDNGYAFSGRMLLVIILPGPILLIEGKANLLKERAKLDKESDFRALSVLDKQAGTFQVNIDAKYKLDKLIDIHGGAEAFFDLKKAENWHLYLGEKEPPTKRIRARVFQLFDANSYLMLSAHGVATGAWIGLDWPLQFGPLSVSIGAWLEGNAAISWNPVQFYGDLWLHGHAVLRVFGIGIGLGLNTTIKAQAPKPYHLDLWLDARIGLPWPLKPFVVHIHIEWGSTQDTPDLPDPILKEVAIEHLKTSASWPLEKENPHPDEIPVVPLDCRPHITFVRPVHDDKPIGGNPQPPSPETEKIGALAVRYSLQEILLEKQGPQDTTWQPVPNKLSGSWAPVPPIPDGKNNTEEKNSREVKTVAQTKLWLWSETPFDYTRRSGPDWDEWFKLRFKHYPCIDIPKDEVFCLDFSQIDPPPVLVSPWESQVNLGLVFKWYPPVPIPVTKFTPHFGENAKGVRFPGSNKPLDTCIDSNRWVSIHLPRSAKKVTIFLDFIEVKGVCVQAFNTKNEVAYGPQFSRESEINITGSDIKSLKIWRIRPEDFYITKICYIVGVSDEEKARLEKMAKQVESELARWSDRGYVLEPYTRYKLTVNTANKRDKIENKASSSRYFRTEGPPGLATLSKGDLNDLGRYIEQTIPATVPPEGKKPLLPRPVYRTDNIGVDFNKNYVEIMYRLSRRDLGIYLYDSNNNPVTDVLGRPIVLSSSWRYHKDTSLTESKDTWINIIRDLDCFTIDERIKIPGNPILVSAAKGQVLAPDTLYEARLIPLLLHEDFKEYKTNDQAAGPGGTLGGWKVVDENNTVHSNWQVKEWGDPPAPCIIKVNDLQTGTMLVWDHNPYLPADHAEQSQNWSNYRFSVYLRSTGSNSMGVVFRYKDKNNYYRFSMDSTNKRLECVDKGNVCSLIEPDPGGYIGEKDYLVTIEAMGSALGVYLDNQPVFIVNDNKLPEGGIGLYCRGKDTRFCDIRVDDFGKTARVVYSFRFITSRFTDFFHHIHSYQDESWTTVLNTMSPTDKDLLNLISFSVSPDKELVDNEKQAYMDLARYVPGGAAHQNPVNLETTYIKRNNQSIAILVRSPEPIEWEYTKLELFRNDQSFLKSSLPGDIKITDVAFDSSSPGKESVTLLLRNPTNLSGYRIQYRSLPGPGEESWKTFYTFGKENLLPAGTIVRVYACKGTSKKNTGLSIEERFPEDDKECSNIRQKFQPGVIDLNICKGSAILHMRRFYSEKNYNPVLQFKVMRKADGTGFFIIIPDSLEPGSKIPKGQYRMKFTYSRKNSTKDLVNNNKEEIVVIDIP